MFCCFSLLSYIHGFREKRTEHINFLAFETIFRKQAHCDKKKKVAKIVSVCQFLLVV